jgi:HEAT repeat protein
MTMLSRKSLLILAAICFLIAHAPAAESQADRTRKLIAVLQSNAPVFDKARACQQLGESGTSNAIPALAALLADEHLSAYARSGLEGIPDPAAAEALRNATATLKGNQLVGVVNSLGVIRDPHAVGLLKKLAADPSSSAAREALLALGRIGTVEAIATISQVLATGPDTRRDDAAAACLLAAEKQLVGGQTANALTLYDGVRNARVSPLCRAAATKGAIVARKDEGVPLLIEQLRSSERLFRNAALAAIREIPSDAVADALNSELKQAPAELQIQLLTALVDCHNTQSLELLRDKASDADSQVRKTALLVLGRIGGAPEARVLLQSLADNRSPEESALALNALKQMERADIDAQIIEALTNTKAAGPRIQFIRLLESRRVTSATAELLKVATSSDPEVCAAALSALGSLAAPADLPSLISLTRAATDNTVRKAAEGAVISLCTRTGIVAEGCLAVLAELKQASDSRTKNSWMSILASLGDPKGLPAILACLQDPNEAVAIHAMEELALWPDPTPIDDLFAVVQKAANPVQHRRALDTIIRLATSAAEEQQRPPETVVKWFRLANQAAQTSQERRLIISGLGQVKQAESLHLLAPYLDDTGLQAEAAVAILQIGPALLQQDPAALHEALRKITATAKTEDLRNRASKLASTIPSQGKRTSLFDGRSLAGWEGDTNVWRVRDGTLVGGSTNGNARNEFLTTTRNYTNFTLRLEYKLVGTEGFVNGGVQFHSVRTKEPANEMSGYQADIGAGHSGCLYDESRRNTFLARAGDDQIKRLEKPGDWNCYEVRCDGPRIQIVLNGERTVDYTESNAAIPLDGLIGLQIHGGCKAEISFRNLAIEEVSSMADN